MGRCQTCNAPIEWAVSASTGKKMPLDAAGVANGNVILRDGKAHVLTPIELSALPPGTPRFVSHYVSCKQAEAWRSGAVSRGRGAKW